MAYDAALAARLRGALEGVAPLAERRMMGGLCFMWGDHMLCGADRPREGAPRFLFRVGPAGLAAALARPGARPMEMRGRVMRGFVFVDSAGCDETALRDWVRLAQDYVATLPPKRG